MESFLPLLTVASITLLAVLSPGPNFVVITKNAMIYSRQAGLYTATGVVVGNAIYVAAGALFYLAIFTVVLPPETMVSMKVMAAVIILIIVLVWHPLLAWFFSNRLFQSFYARSDRWINVIFSLLLVGLAIRTISS